MNLPDTIRWQNQQLTLLDQRKLPHEVTYREINTLDDAIDAIRTLTVRGAPAIGVAAGYALASSLKDADEATFEPTLAENAARLRQARPTAVNLGWSIDRLLARAKVEPTYAALVAEAEAIDQEDRDLCQRIGEHGAPLLKDARNVLTHCNAGSLAVSMRGTATAPIYQVHEAGQAIHVYADETRPLLQGARLTAWELSQAGVPVTLVCDNMAATLMAQDKVDCIIVGTDRVARNGDVANKIGTLGLAVLAKHFGVPFYVACPSSTYDVHTADGAAIPIEERDPSEVLGAAAADVAVFNPAFDVTPADLVTAIITDRGVVHEPNEARLRAVLAL